MKSNAPAQVSSLHPVRIQSPKLMESGVTTNRRIGNARVLPRASEPNTLSSEAGAGGLPPRIKCVLDGSVAKGPYECPWISPITDDLAGRFFVYERMCFGAARMCTGS